MTIKTYVNESDNSVLNKDITLVSNNVLVTLKDDTDLINPVLIMSNSLSQSFNYVYIQEFSRYYFVTSRVYSQQRYYVQLGVDVLMSFNTDISALRVIANRSSSRYNTYQIDNEFNKLNYNTIQTQKFPYALGAPDLVLAVAGGGN